MKGIEKIDKSSIAMAIAENKKDENKLQQDHRLTNAKAMSAAETANFIKVNNAQKDAFLALELEEAEAAIESLKGNPELKEAYAAWQKFKDIKFKRAELFLKHGTPAGSMPGLPGGEQSAQYKSPQSFGGYTNGDRQTRTKATDSLRFAVNWSGNAAQATKNFFGNVGNGFKKIGKFFGGK